MNDIIKNKNKSAGRPRKKIDYDAPEVMKFLLLFSDDFTSFDKIPGSILRYSDLEEKNILAKFRDKKMHDGLKKVLPIGNFRKLQNTAIIDGTTDLIDLLRSICKKKGIHVKTAFFARTPMTEKIIVFSKIEK